MLTASSFWLLSYSIRSINTLKLFIHLDSDPFTNTLIEFVLIKLFLWESPANEWLPNTGLLAFRGILLCLLLSFVVDNNFFLVLQHTCWLNVFRLFPYIWKAAGQEEWF